MRRSGELLGQRGNYMRLQDYWDACRAIHAQLTSIATEIKNMAAARCADPSNPRFVALMDQQDALHAQLKKLDQQPLVL